LVLVSECWPSESLHFAQGIISFRLNCLFAWTLVPSSMRLVCKLVALCIAPPSVLRSLDLNECLKCMNMVHLKLYTETRFVPVRCHGYSRFMKKFLTCYWWTVLDNAAHNYLSMT
jgi:hypothetical protein